MMRIGRGSYSFQAMLFLVIGIFLLASCRPAPMTAAASSIPSPTIFQCNDTGNVQTFGLEPLGEIGLYLPSCYERDANFKYPVLYLLPGFGGTHMEWFDTGIAAMTDGLIQSGETAPLIIVTTDNTYEVVKPDDILTILVPYIDSHYRTLTDRAHRAIAGGSLGGATAYLLTFQHPDVFSSAGIFGNGLVTGLDAQVETWLKAIPTDQKPRVFLNSGEQDTFMIQQARALIPILDKYGIEHAEIFTTGGHSGSYWLSNFPAYYQWLMKDWQV